jgi:hypothetical protein
VKPQGKVALRLVTARRRQFTTIRMATAPSESNKVTKNEETNVSSRGKSRLWCGRFSDCQEGLLVTVAPDAIALMDHSVKHWLGIGDGPLKFEQNDNFCRP